MTLKQLYQKASTRSRDEWRNFIVDCRDHTRGWIQAHGEMAAILGFIAGILIVLFFRVFAWLVFFVFVTFFILWLRTPEAD